MDIQGDGLAYLTDSEAEGLDRCASPPDRSFMRAARASGAMATMLGLVLRPTAVLAASVPNFPPDPVGEKVYQAQLYHHMLLPVAIIAFALLAACLVHIIVRKAHPDSVQ
jgi:hypothetical protein